MIKLKPSEVRFWQEVFIAVAGCANADSSSVAARWADSGVEKLRERLEDPGPRPDAGRL